MNAAGLAAGTGKSVMKLSAAKTLEKMVRITAVQLRMQGMAIVFRRQWENPGFIGVDEYENSYLPMGFSNFKIEGGDLAAP